MELAGQTDFVRLPAGLRTEFACERDVWSVVAWRPRNRLVKNISGVLARAFAFSATPI